MTMYYTWEIQLNKIFSSFSPFSYVLLVYHLLLIPFSSQYSFILPWFYNTLSARHSNKFRYTSFIILYIFSYIILFHLFIIIIIVYIILFMFIYLFISSHHILTPFGGLERLSQWIRMVGSPLVIHTPFNFSRKSPLSIFNFNNLHSYIYEFNWSVHRL